ncbi:hypothetical protein KC333_g131 [Hortaea werneckii]|nr:hypothetical protein KC333_g131 [Hortaea werneckii]
MILGRGVVTTKSDTTGDKPVVATLLCDRAKPCTFAASELECHPEMRCNLYGCCRVKASLIRPSFLSCCSDRSLTSNARLLRSRLRFTSCMKRSSSDPMRPPAVAILPVSLLMNVRT